MTHVTPQDRLPRLIKGLHFYGLIQVAGIHDQDEAKLLADAGVHALGFPLRLPVNAQDLDEEQAARVIAALPQSTQSVCITYETNPNAIVELCAKLGTGRVQLHADLPTHALATLNKLSPHLYVIKSLIIKPDASNDSLKRAIENYAPFVDAFITDSFDPETGATGATGKTHDWSLSRNIAYASPHPVILAGGLRPDNVYQAIMEVCPAGIDAHTGLEGADGYKDQELVRRFVNESTRAFRDML